MNTIKRLVSRSGSLFAALAFTVAVVAPTVISSTAFASGQFSPRKLTMSSQTLGTISTDANGTAVAAGQGGNGVKVNNTFNFTLGTSGATIGSLALQYCTTPLFGTTCTAPTGLNTATIATVASQSGFAATAPALDTSTVANTGGIFTTTPCSGSSPYRSNCILMKRGTPTLDTGTPAITLSFGQGGSTDWITNPTVVGTFYVRITTFSDIAYTTVVDQAAVAGSVNTAIDITAKVQEKLNFSVAAATVAPGATCTALTGTGAITLGSAGVLDNTTAYDNHSYFRISTNAANGTSILYSGDTLKSAGGTNSITAAGGTKTLSAPGTSQFGLGLDSSDTLAGNGYLFNNLTAAAQYNSAQGNINPTIAAMIALDTASMSTPVQIASAASGTTVSCDTGSVRYVANISTTTKPGIYQTTINYIAVPTF